MDHSKKSTYLFSIDALRVIAILGVLLIHLTTKTLSVVGLDPNLAPFSLFLNQAARFAVPLFFFISGFVLELNYREKLSYMTFFKKRASRIIIPFLFWSIFYYLLSHSPSQLISSNFFLAILHGKASYQLYFIPTLILFYLFFPLLHNLINILKKPLVLIFLVLLQGILVSWDYYFKNFETFYILRIALLIWLMFVLGMVTSHYKERVMEFVKKNFKVFVILLLVLLPIIFFHSKLFFLSTRRIGYIYSQYHALNYLYSLIFAGVTYYVLETKQWGRKVFITLSKLSFFVFFVHVFILENVWKLLAQPLINSQGKNAVGQLWFDPLFFVIIAGISFGIAYVVHKIPHLSKLTG